VRPFLAAWHGNLRRIAEETPPKRRLNAAQNVTWPWTLAAFLIMAGGTAVGRALGFSGLAQLAILFPIGFLVVLVGCYAAWRIAAYGWRFDRTPPAAPWTDTAHGQILIEALRRVTLNGLSKVTPATRLREDLKLTSSDISELLAILSRDLGTDERSPAGSRDGDVTVQSPLDAMAPIE
jgi:hypothetical protein